MSKELRQLRLLAENVMERNRMTTKYQGWAEDFPDRAALTTLAQGILNYEDDVSEKWDRRFLDMADLVASWSKDPSTKTGAVIVRPDRTVASVGFNGFPRGMSDDEELYEDRDLKYSRIVHCEVNAMIHSAEPINGCTLYTVPFMSCDRCVVQMVQAGITRFVFPKATAAALTRWKGPFELTTSYMEEAKIPWTEYAR